jgi:tryptophan synthase beta chain
MKTHTQETGRFGPYGGRFVAETLVPALEELEAAWQKARRDRGYGRELDALLSDFVGRPTPLTETPRLSAEVGLDVWLKREDLCHTGAHKINNTVGQALLALRMKKKRIIAETGAGQHGVATATVAAKFGLPCRIYMGEEDVRRQQPNVLRMRLLGAEIVPVSSGSRTLKDAMNEALRDWVTNVRDTYYIIGSTAGPHPYPTLVRELQAVIGREARAQVKKMAGRLPAAAIACVGGGSNAMGLFHAFRGDRTVKLVGVEAAGDGLDSERHSATLTKGRPGVLHGSRSYVLQSAGGQVAEAHSIAPGLDYPGVGPEHALLKDTGRAVYVSATDEEALRAFSALGRLEGIIPALESSHAIAYLWRLRKEQKLAKGATVVVSLSGRGDKDLASVEARLSSSGSTVSRVAE